MSNEKFANLNPDALDEIIENLKNLPPREDHSLKQRSFYSQISPVLFTKQLEHLIKERNWFIGIIMSGSMLDFAGKTRLLWKQSKTSKNEIRKIYKFTFGKTIEQLHKQKIIDRSTYEKMKKIRDTRNEAAHNVPYQVALSLEKKQNKTLEDHIISAINIIEVLFSHTY